MISIDDVLSGFLDEELGKVSIIFKKQLECEHDLINQICGHIDSYRGKMLRPSLVLLSALASGAEEMTEAHRVTAAVVEMIHMATLVHDDILDEADTRRGGRTVNEIHGNEMAVMLGDYLISNAFHLCSSLKMPDVNLLLGSTTNTLCKGELIQLGNRKILDVDEDVYFTIIRKKTASLIGASCRLGSSITTDDDEMTLRLERFGIASGIAFQITDDLLDLIGEKDVVGKSVGRDIEKGKMTLPLIYALNDCSGSDHDDIVEMIKSRNIDSLREIVNGTGAIERTLDKAMALVDDAKSELRDIPDSPAKSMLIALADGIIERKY
tara:strand:+ start:27840 stop:28811 length:972 start_codon:yes stop_codon:yes gene_type:complete